MRTFLHYYVDECTVIIIDPWAGPLATFRSSPLVRNMRSTKQGQPQVRGSQLLGAGLYARNDPRRQENISCRHEDQRPYVRTSLKAKI